MSRSFLFIPGDVPRMIQQLEVFGADAIILDLEDSVSITQKDEARYLVESFLTKHQYLNPLIYIRINPTDSEEYKNDITSLQNLRIHGIVLPKASLKGIEKLAKDLPKCHIIALMETPEAFLEITDIAKHKRVEGLLLGAEDLAQALNLERTEIGDEILYVRSQVVLTAKAYKKLAIDTPYTNLNALEGLLKDAQKARQLGFDAKASIHPNHIDTIHQAFSPSHESIKRAKRIIAYAESHQSMRFSLDGKMVDKPIIDHAKAILDAAKRYRLD